MDSLKWIGYLRKQVIVGFLAGLISLVLLGSGSAFADKLGSHVYFSQGVHNNYQCEPPSKCIADRNPTDPRGPLYPKWWTSDWKMYRVFNNYQDFPPPYDSPPNVLSPSDYEVSDGSTYYDSTYIPKDRDGAGAMMEHYEKKCLPIFPQENNYTCSFVSLGNKAYFLRYEDRPPNTPKCCQFSLKNHPPRQDFLKHLPYKKEESAHLKNSLLAYSLTVDPGILFGYAFNKALTPDSFDRTAELYRHPQSFYFSGSPTDPPLAPIVSQNYRNFRMEQPKTSETWDQVAKMCSPKPEFCCLFKDDCPPNSLSNSPATASWANLKYTNPN